MQKLKLKISHSGGGLCLGEKVHEDLCGIIGIGAETAGGLRNVLRWELGTKSGQVKGLRSPYSEQYSQV